MKEKKCKDCGGPRGHNNSLISRCKACVYKRSEANPKQTRIKQVSTKNKNKIAKFDIRTKKEIVYRDKVCVLCSKPGTDCHHLFFSNQAEYGEDRNNVEKGCLLCRLCHGRCHSNKQGEGERQEVIDYLNNLK